jgi:hypothetical protein
MRWQPVQWHADAISGAAVILNLVRPQRHPPSQGNFQSAMPKIHLFVEAEKSGRWLE